LEVIGAILGYNRLSPGVAVVYADLDYDSMQACMESLRSRRGVSDFKDCASRTRNARQPRCAYRHAFNANPRIRLVLLTHFSHRTGLVQSRLP
jgi:isopenicillin-N epimerase